MMFIGIIFVILYFLLLLLGVILAVVGLVLLIMRFVHRKNSSKRILGVVGTAFLAVGLSITVVLPVFSRMVSEKASDQTMDRYCDPSLYPVTNAVLKRDGDLLRKRLNGGADPNEIFDGECALYYACGFDGHAETDAVELLVSRGADVTYVGASGRSVMQKLLVANVFYGESEGFYRAAVFLLDNGYDVNERNADGVPLISFAQVSPYRDDYTLLLTERGADVNAADNFGRTPLMWAVGSSDDGSVLPEISEKYTFQCYSLRSVQILLDRGADPAAADLNGFTAADYFAASLEYDKRWFQYEDAQNDPEYLGLIDAIRGLIGTGNAQKNDRYPAVFYLSTVSQQIL